ncbi:Serine/threonine-protein kinase pkn1 [Sedimentisphaera cyanobacteriorum]|uniref:Serine/threonine-protein kinase pkn1 n=1 Tax=Sedimentisphaera cyanobacteriorum TaxID=1940790 RepID=A0A1Q2HMN0_9BACT|nr:SUMF1/EgtB/PvdO family nonheme iron enzyme [Sedimentisphaera cyanobacteriorum]AQQ08688.1 Serine/threonine-protein kinase pkn1 [Sedimentisphaera cyanobacteriorum]
MRFFTVFLIAVLIAASSFGQWDSALDHDSSGVIDLADLSYFANRWLETSDVEVPSVWGLSKAEAEASIISAGLSVGSLTQQHSLSFPEDTVISQYPAAGDSVPAGSRVNIMVSFSGEDGFNGMSWVYIDEPEFTGYVSKYEITNAQYCKFLTDALACEDIDVRTDGIYGVRGAYNGQLYYDIDDPHAQISYSDGSFYSESRSGNDMTSHPVVEVSWFGAKAFCDYYGYILPSEQQWQAGADYHGAFDYGCGTSIDSSKANYALNNPAGLSSFPHTSSAGEFGEYGYGLCDMAGNVWEWTDTIWGEGYRVLKGGSWCDSAENCKVESRLSGSPLAGHFNYGFRVFMRE